MTRADKQNMALELETLKAILQNTGNLSLLQNIEESTDKKEFSGALDFAIKTLEAQVDKLSQSTPQRIVNNILTKKPAVHFNLNATTEPTAKRFDFGVFARRAMQLLRGEG